MIAGLFRLLATLAALALSALLLYQGWILAHVLWWKHNDPASTAFMRAGLDRLRADDPGARLQHQWVPYAQISSHLKRAVIAAEDARFMEHRGFDVEGIQTALEKNLEKGAPVAGGSTITQQLAKNLFLSGRRSYLRKGQEAVITLMIEATWDKRRILEVYLNVVEWGDGIYGAEAAARHYYRKPAARLGRSEAAQLAAMLPRPRYYQHHRTRLYQQRVARILRYMNHAQVPR